MDQSIRNDYLKPLGLVDGQRAPIGCPVIISHALWYNAKLQQVGYGDIEPEQVKPLLSGLAETDLLIAFMAGDKSVEDFVYHGALRFSDNIFIFRKNAVYKVLPTQFDELSGKTKEIWGIEVIWITRSEAVDFINGFTQKESSMDIVIRKFDTPQDRDLSRILESKGPGKTVSTPQEFLDAVAANKGYYLGYYPDWKSLTPIGEHDVAFSQLGGQIVRHLDSDKKLVSVDYFDEFGNLLKQYKL